MLANTWQLPGASVDGALVTLCHCIFILTPAVAVLFVANKTCVSEVKKKKNAL